MLFKDYSVDHQKIILDIEQIKQNHSERSVSQSKENYPKKVASGKKIIAYHKAFIDK